MPFLKDTNGNPLTVYRGESALAEDDRIRCGIRTVYFTDKETANRNADFPSRPMLGREFAAPRVFPVRLEMKLPFINTPDSVMLKVSDLIGRLGESEALRIVQRFSMAVESTEYWTDHLNKDSVYDDLYEYLEASNNCLEGLYFKASWFFESESEVARLTRLGYDGAIHAAYSMSFKKIITYCVFDKAQIHYALSLKD